MSAHAAAPTQLPRHCSPPCQPPSLTAAVNETLPSGSTQTGPLPSAEAAARESKEPKTRATPLGDPGCEQGRSGSRQPEKQELPARNSKYRKLSHKRMRIVLDALTEYPIYARAAAKAGIHRRTLERWLKCSEAGDDGYDIEWQGETWRFHERCTSAIEEAHDKLLLIVWQKANGVIFKTDPLLVDLGFEGLDAYAQDENGNFIVEAVGRPNAKMAQFFLEFVRPEKWGKHRKSDIPRTGGVLVIGEPKPKNSCDASIKARKWKSVLRKLRELKD